MRELGERVKDVRVEQADGIRVEENGGWAQLVPDPDEPLFHIYAEGADGERVGRARPALPGAAGRGAARRRGSQPAGQVPDVAGAIPSSSG